MQQTNKIQTNIDIQECGALQSIIQSAYLVHEICTEWNITKTEFKSYGSQWINLDIKFF